MTLPRCPRCGFSYAWDGYNCTHCHLPIPTRASWASFASLVRFDYAHPNRDERKAVLLACAFVRRVAHLLPPGRTNALDILDLAEGFADGGKAVVAEKLRALGTNAADPGAATVSQNDAGSRAVLAAVHVGRMCANGPDAGLHHVAANARAAVAWAAFPERAWATFPLPPALEHLRSRLTARPSHNEMRNHYNVDPEMFAAVQELNRASGTLEMTRRDRDRDEESAQCRLYREVFGYPFAAVEFDAAWRTSSALGLVRQMYGTRDFAAMPILADALQEAGCDDAEILDHCRGETEHVRGCWVADMVLNKS